MMLECHKKGLLDPIEAGAHVLAGYLSQNAITSSEVAILKIAIEARITQSLVLGQHTFKHEQPGNFYILNTQKTGWHMLKLLRAMSQEELFAKWKMMVPHFPIAF